MKDGELTSDELAAFIAERLSWRPSWAEYWEWIAERGRKRAAYDRLEEAKKRKREGEKCTG